MQTIPKAMALTPDEATVLLAALTACAAMRSEKISLAHSANSLDAVMSAAKKLPMGDFIGLVQKLALHSGVANATELSLMIDHPDKSLKEIQTMMRAKNDDDSLSDSIWQLQHPTLDSADPTCPHCHCGRGNECCYCEEIIP